MSHFYGPQCICCRALKTNNTLQKCSKCFTVAEEVERQKSHWPDFLQHQRSETRRDALVVISGSGGSVFTNSL